MKAIFKGFEGVHWLRLKIEPGIGRWEKSIGEGWEHGSVGEQFESHEAVRFRVWNMHIGLPIIGIPA